MARQVKPFGEHSQRWQREQLNNGVNPKLWDRWRLLSAKSRKGTSPFEYSTGKPVRQQLRAPLLDAATKRVLAIHQIRGATRFDNSPIKLAAVRRNLDHPRARMSNAKLRQLATLSPQRLVREVDDSLSRRYDAGDRSPFWYEKRG